MSYKTALVIPTNRQQSLVDILKAWHETGHYWDQIIIVEDNLIKTFEINKKFFPLWPNIYHFSWSDIDAELGEISWIISRQDSAIRSYGFLKAYFQNADIIFTIDDDCYPTSCNFVEEHIKNLTQTPRWIESIPNQRTRGFPYKNFGVCENVKISVGFWEGVPDFDSIQTLSGANQNIQLPATKVMPTGQYMPICGMNLAFKREVAPICYFALSGKNVPYRRFDDIWFGVIAKKICDHLNLMITCGEPNVFHQRASDPMVNLVKEAPGIAFHEKFWEIIHNIDLTARTPKDCMLQISQGLVLQDNPYAIDLGDAIRHWCSLF